MSFYRFFTNKNNIIIILSIIITILSFVFYLFDTMNIKAQQYLNKIYTNTRQLQETYGNFINENVEIVSENDIYIIPTIWDRLDLLAYTYYKDSSLYWVIASANALPGDSLIPPLGKQLRIPADVQNVQVSYTRINSIR